MPITIEAAPPDAAEALQLLTELDASLNPHLYPLASRHAFSVAQLVQQRVAFFVTRVEGAPAGCGGLKLFDGEYGEVKRMYVRPAYRGLGLGQAMLEHLAAYAQARQIPLLRLETGIYQTNAIRLYERFGFQRRAPFGEYGEDPLSVYFEKALTPA